jgi:hypothetical protein
VPAAIVVTERDEVLLGGGAGSWSR